MPRRIQKLAEIGAWGLVILFSSCPILGLLRVYSATDPLVGDEALLLVCIATLFGLISLPLGYVVVQQTRAAFEPGDGRRGSEDKQ